MFFSGVLLPRTLKEAEANKLKLTSQYLELKFIEAIANNSKIYFGDKVNSLSLSLIVFYLLLLINLLHRYLTWFWIKGCSETICKMWSRKRTWKPKNLYVIGWGTT